MASVQRPYRQPVFSRRDIPARSGSFGNVRRDHASAGINATRNAADGRRMGGNRPSPHRNRQQELARRQQMFAQRVARPTNNGAVRPPVHASRRVSPVTRTPTRVLGKPGSRTSPFALRRYRGG